jgi:hypothetical protein
MSIKNQQAKAREMFEARAEEIVEAAARSEFTSVIEVDWEDHRIRIGFDDMPLLLHRGKRYEVQTVPTAVVDLCFPPVADPRIQPFHAYLWHPRDLAHPNYSGVSGIPLLCHGVLGLAIHGELLLQHIHRMLANDPEVIRTDDSMNVDHAVVEFIRDHRSTELFPTDRRRLYTRRPEQ